MKKLYSLFIVLVIIFFSIDAIWGIPAFARKYGMSCKTCHSPIPKLKAYGDEFAGNGFVLKDNDAPRYYVKTGDEVLSLIRDFPIAARLEGYLTYNKEDNGQSDFYAPLLFKIMTGGTIFKDISYYVYYILESGEVGKIEDAWFMLNNLFGTELDFTIGQFQVSDPLFKRELRLTRDDYYIYKVKPGKSMADLTYDRGIMFSYGFDTGTDLVIEVVNGSGIGEEFIGGTFDNDKYKNLFGRISQEFSDNVRFGGFVYWGQETGSSDTIRTYENEITFWGIDGTIGNDFLELNLQYGNRKDSNPFFVGLSPLDLETTKRLNPKTYGGFAELIYRPEGDESKWYMVALFNHIESDDNDWDYKSISFHLGYLLARNIRLVGEFTHDIKNKFANVGIGFVSAF